MSDSVYRAKQLLQAASDELPAPEMQRLLFAGQQVDAIPLLY